MSYKIETVVDGLVKPGDELKGKVFIRSEEKKPQKIKGIGARITEYFEEDVWDWDDHDKEYELTTKHGGTRLKDYEIFKADTKVEPGETKEFDFQIKLPSIPGRKKWGWYVAIYFYVKAGMLSSGAKDNDEATCILPVPGSTRMPNFGEIPGGPAVDPPRTAPPRPQRPPKE